MAGRSPAPPADPALAGARTALSWRRSAMSVAATGVLVAKTGLDGGQPILAFGAAGVLAVAAAITWMTRGRMQTGRVPGDAPPERRGRALAALCGVSLFSAAVALVVVLVSAVR